MNKEMLKHLVSVLNTIAFAQFAVFGYTSLNIGNNLPSNWGQMAIAGIIFVTLQVGALWL